MPVEVLNRQRRFPVDVTRLVSVAEGALVSVRRGGADVSVTISNDAKLRELNRQFRGKDKATDVLSFEYDAPKGPLGDVVVSVDRARAQADEHGHSLQHELELLTLHGTLHVCGYDHETDDGQMDRIERRLRRTLLEPA